MTTQDNLFDFAKGLRLREEGVARVGANANQHWKKEVDNAILMLAKIGREFTSDDVWKIVHGKAVTPEPRAMGAAFLSASRKGWIRPTGFYWQSQRPECHGRRIAVWLGTSQVA